MAHTFKLHIANEDTTTGRYDELLLSTIAGFAGYTSIEIQTRGAFEGYAFEGEAVKGLGGKIIRPISKMRNSFAVKLQPFTYKASDWDLSDWELLRLKLLKLQKTRCGWIELTAIGTALAISRPYHDATKAIPVQLTEFSFEDNEGKKSVVLTFEKKFIEVSA